MEPRVAEILHRISARGEAVFARDANERIIYWSGKCEELLGLPERSALGRHCHDVVAGRDASGNIHCLHNCRIAHQSRDESDPVHRFPLTVPAPGGWRRFDVDTFSIPSYHPSVFTLIHVLHERKNGDSRTADPPGDGKSFGEPLRPIHAEENHFEMLTSREREILRQLAMARTTPEIAQEFGISPATVRNHIAALLQRLNVHSKVAAVALAYREHLL